jgi:chorismate synthase
VPRAVPIVESMAAMVILDQILTHNSKKIWKSFHYTGKL